MLKIYNSLADKSSVFSKKKFVEEQFLRLFFITAFTFSIVSWQVVVFGDTYHFYVGFILIAFLLAIKIAVNPVTSRRTQKFAAIVATLLTFNFLFSVVIGSCEKSFEKMLISDIVLFITMVLGFEIAVKSTIVGWRKLPITAIFLLVIFVFSCLVEFSIPELFPEKKGYQAIGLYSGVLGEPSFLGWSSVTLFAVALFGNLRIKLIGCILWFLIAVLSGSGTFMLFSVLLMFYWIILKPRKYIIGFGILTITLIIIYLDIKHFRFIETYLPYYSERINTIYFFALDNNDLLQGSHWYYAQGIKDGWYAFKETYGFGVGHNRMGCLGIDHVDAAYLYLYPNDEPMSRGAFILAKIIYEWGLIGLIIIWIFIGYILNYSKRAGEYKYEMSRAILFMILCAFTFRSNVYTDHMYIVIALTQLIPLKDKS